MQLKPIMYSNLDGSVAIVHAMPKAKLEKELGRLLSDIEYEYLVWDRSVPSDAINPRYLDHDEIPDSNEFRQAWIDADFISTIGICLEKAAAIQLNRIREKRLKLFEKLDADALRLIGTNLPKAAVQIAHKKHLLRIATDPLKALNVKGKFAVEDYNNDILEIIKNCGKLDEDFFLADNFTAEDQLSEVSQMTLQIELNKTEPKIGGLLNDIKTTK